MTRIDMEKASRQDVEIMKRLMLEFKDELDALGVKVDQLDKRVAKLEDGVGGWKIRGVFRFDAKFGDSDNRDVVGNDDGASNYAYNRGGKNEFTKERFRLFLTKTIDENTYFYAQYRTGDNAAGGDGRGDQQHMRWSHLFVDTKLPYDIGLRVGRFAVDFEGDMGMYIEEDALWGDFRTDGFQLKKNWGMLNATVIVGRNDAHDNTDQGRSTHMTYVLDLNVQPNEKFFVGATGYWGIEDSARSFEDPAGNTLSVGDVDVNTYAVYAGFNFTPAIALKGIYYFQDLGSDVPITQSTGVATATSYAAREYGINLNIPNNAGYWEDSPTAWKAILDIKQDALKFTSLWVEYNQQDNSFWGGPGGRYGIGGNDYGQLDSLLSYADPTGTSKIIFARAKQQWNDKWSTYLRYGQWDYDTEWLDDSKSMGIGVGYQYTPAIYFELCYDVVDYGSDGYGVQNYLNRVDKGSVFRFRTNVNF